MSARDIRVFLPFFFLLQNAMPRTKAPTEKSSNYIPVQDNAIGFLVTRYTCFRSMIRRSKRTNENATSIRATGFTRRKTFEKWNESKTLCLVTIRFTRAKLRASSCVICSCNYRESNYAAAREHARDIALLLYFLNNLEINIVVNAVKVISCFKIIPCLKFISNK